MAEIDPCMIPLPQQISCVKREIALRVRVYHRWVDQSKMTQDKADHEIAAMKAVLATLEAQLIREAPPRLL